MLELKSPQERPKRRPRGSKRRQEAAKRRQDSAERRQESAKRRQDAPKSDLGAILARFWTPRGRPNLDFHCNCRRKSRFPCFSKGVGKRDPNRSQRRPLGDTLERFWSDLGAPGGAFSSHFRSIFPCLKRSVEPARARGVPSGAQAQNAERGRGARPRSLTRMLC